MGDDKQLSSSSKVVTWALSGTVNGIANSGWPEPEGLQGHLASGMSGSPEPVSVWWRGVGGLGGSSVQCGLVAGGEVGFPSSLSLDKGVPVTQAWGKDTDPET